MKKTIITYYAKYDSLGYYAKNQPNYEWSFTQDITKAYEYQTQIGALDRLFSLEVGSNHNYVQHGRSLVEKHSTINTNGNNTSISSFLVTKNFDDSLKLYENKEALKFKKRTENNIKKQEIEDKAFEKYRIEYEKNLNEKLTKQDNFYSPKCVEIQKLLNTPAYLEKRKTLMINYHHEDDLVVFYELTNSTHLSKYFSLLKFFTTLQILFDNNQEFSMNDYKIRIKKDVMEDVRNLFMINGIFKDDFCKFGKDNELFK